MNPNPARLFLPILLGVAALLMAGNGCSKRSGTPAFETALVKRGDITQRITATGSLSAVLSVDVGSEISGTIKSVAVDYNTPVTKGQLVAMIDPAGYRAVVHQEQAQLASAKAALELAQLTADRKRNLVSQHAGPQADLDTAVANLHQAEASVQNQQAMLERAQVDLDHCEITAPVDGIIISRKIDVGQTVAAAMTTPVLFTIVNDLTKMTINASISEADIGVTAEGQTAEFTVDAFPEEVFTGKIVQVRKAPATVDNVVTYTTVIAVENSDKKLYPGMTADVSILVAHRKNVLKIPNTALRFTPPDNVTLEPAGDATASTEESTRSKRFVYLTTGTPKTPRLKAVKLKVGVADGVDTEVIEGLKEGDKVVTAATDHETKNSKGGPPPPR